VPRLRLAVLVSGRGSNLEALLRASSEGRMDADVALVVSSKPDAGGLEIARRAGVPTFVAASKARAQADHEAQMRPAIDAARVDLVLLAGYMRILTPAFLRAYEGRLLNIHPSLLPAFPGLDAQGQAHARGVRIAGATVHFVSEEVDAGPILAQAAVAVPPSASADDLRARILAVEHQLYAHAVQLVASGRARYDHGRVAYAADVRAGDAALFAPEAAAR
jgi:phosphoribosylglycinamide formyltransferase-1